MTEKIYICRRDEEYWMGALVILASSRKQAIELYKKIERDDEEPYEIIEEKIASPLPRVVWDDSPR